MAIIRDVGLAVGCLWTDEPRAAARVAWTFLSAFAILGLSCGLIWAACNVSWRVRDEHAAVGLLVAGLAWIGALWLIWRPYRASRPALTAILITLLCADAVVLSIVIADSLRLGGRAERGAAAASGMICSIVTLQAWGRYVRGLDRRTSRLARAGRYRALMHSIATVVVTIGLCVLADEFGGRDEEILVLAVILFGAAALLLAWVPTMARAHRTALRNPDDEINVNCPACGYSLIGLRELRCPECGVEFVLDELIRAQDYDLAREHDVPPPGRPAPVRPPAAAERN